MPFLTFMFIFVSGLALLIQLYPFGLADILIEFARWLVTSYNKFKSCYRRWVIQREGVALWNEVVKQTPVIAKQQGFTVEEALQTLHTHKTELVEIYGTRLVKQTKPYLFEEIEVNFDEWL